MSARVVVLCLDASEPSLLARWMESGDLPFLAALDARGSSLPITNLKGFGDGVFWPSASTGVNPAKHGRMYSSHFDPSTYSRIPFEDDSLHAPQFWEILDDAGLQTATVDAVHAALRPLQNGVHICDWMTHERQERLRTFPPELAAELLQQYGDDPLDGDSDAFIIATGDYPDLVARLERRMETKASALMRLLFSRDWDVFTCSFGDPHDIGHLCWHLCDTEHPRFDPALAAALGDPVRTIYMALDQALSQVCAAAGPDATIVVLAGPGMERLNTFNRSLDQALWDLETSSPAPAAARSLSPRGLVKRRLAGLWRGLVPEVLRSRLKQTGLIGRRLQRASQSMRQNRRYFSQPHNANAGAVRINLRGRETHGMVEPGMEFQRTVEWIAEEFRQIHDLQGVPLVADIAFPTSAYTGDHVDALPDILLIWNRKVDVGNLISPTLGRLSDQAIIPRTGDHTPHGQLWLVGEGLTLEAGGVDAVPMDLLPTLLDLFGISMPNHDGRSLLMHEGPAEAVQHDWACSALP
ncbi:MAG: alkaline phosphatase family protein [Gammaproteobacteria bacterium]|nr:alkaline phosphatase family protein [Gammaproteobacteria bacterium]